MNKSDKNNEDYTEKEVSMYFYGYEHGAITNDSRDFMMPFMVEMRAPNTDSNPILNTTMDEELLIYSIMGLESFDVYSSMAERSEQRLAKGKIKREYLW